MKLYELTKDYIIALNRYDESENEEQLKYLEEYLNSLQASIRDKAIAIAKYIIDERGEIEKIKNEINRLTNRLKSKERKEEWFKQYIADSLIKANIAKIESDVVRISFRESKSVMITDPSIIPAKYKKIKTEELIDKNQIKEDWDRGVGVEGTEIIKKQNIQIK